MQKSNEFGPIAKTYAELQAIQQLEIAFHNPKNLYTKEEHLIRTLLQCVELIYLNASDLAKRQKKAFISGALPSVMQNSCWHTAILNICTKIIAYAASISNTLPYDKVSEPFDIPSISFYKAEYNSLCEFFIQYIDKNIDAFKQSIPSGLVSNPITAISHNTKLIYQYNEIIFNRLSTIKTPLATCSDISDYLQSEALKTAFSTPAISGETYFTQFRLLHQVPEILGMYCLNRIDALKNSGNDIDKCEKIVSALRVITDLMQIIIDCSEPILNYLVPLEYHKIRENLGKTSGLQSEILAKRLFRDDFEWLTDKVYTLTVSPNIDRILSDQMKWHHSRLAQEVLRWRDMHIGFPRNLLGGFGAKSLIGSEDALVAAYNMRKAFDSKISCTSIEPNFLPNIEPSNARQRLDNKLLEITSSATKRKFKNVQDRTGPIFGSDK